MHRIYMMDTMVFFCSSYKRCALSPSIPRKSSKSVTVGQAALLRHLPQYVDPVRIFPTSLPTEHHSTRVPAYPTLTCCAAFIPSGSYRHGNSTSSSPATRGRV